MLRSLYSAVSGIDVNQKSMDVIGNNIANVNTIGFKQGRAIFQDLLSQTLSGGKSPTDSRGGINPRQVGTGAYLVAVDNIIEQGVIKSTASPTDLAIQGNGFFVLRGEGTTQYYSRAGDFNFDKFGALTNPSGYRVQGWMADPITGKLQYNAAASDIVLTDAHNIMQAKATSNITYAGILDSGSTGSQATFRKMLTQATASMSIFNALPAAGSGGTLGLATNDKVTVQAHATGLTSMDQIFTDGGQAIGLRVNSNVVFDVDGIPMEIKYVTTGDNINAGAGVFEFTTMQGLADAITAKLQANGISASAALNMGRIELTAGPAATTFKVNSITSNSSYLTNLFSGLYGSYTAGTARESGEFFFRQDLKATEDFKTLDDLASAIERSLQGNVLDNFSASFMDNIFGLQNGDVFTVNRSLNGVAQAPLNFTYSSNPNPTGAMEFHTLSDLAAAMSTALGSDVTVTVAGEGLNISYSSVGPDTLEFTSFQTSRNAGAITGVSPYLEGVFNSIANQPINNTVRNLNIESISGKGRITYNNQSTTYDLTGFSIAKASSGGLFNDNILQLSAGVLNRGESTASKIFLATATNDTLLLDLFTQGGEPCNFVEDSTIINFNATVGGSALTAANAFTVAVNSSVQDMMTALEEYLGLGKSFNTRQNVVLQDGALTVYGENGEANNIDSLQMTAQPASTMSAFNRDIGAPIKITSASGGRFVSDMTIFDQQGNEHVVQFDFSAHNQERNEWRLTVSTSDVYANVSIDGATTNEIIMVFTPDGKPSYIYDPYTDPINLLPNPSITFNPGNGTNTISGINLHLGTPGTNDGLTLSNSNMTINTAEQDGNALGVLEQKFFNESGEIIGYYTNGLVRTIGQIALATFQNNRGLLKVGDTMFQTTANSGSAAIGTPQSGFRGSIVSNSLEQSNVDLASEFVNMIVTQRGFQANSRVVTTSDEMIQELLNLKR